MNAPLRFHLPEGAMMEISHEIPPDRPYTIPYANSTLRTWPTGCYLEQTVIEKGFGLCLLTFSIQQSVMLRVESLANFTTIQFTLHGEATARLTGYGLLSLVEKTYTPLYIPEGNHLVWFEPGNYTFFYVILTEQHLHLLLEDHPHLEALIQKMLTASTEGMMLERMPINFTIMRLIKKLESLELTGTALKLELHEIAIKIISAYNDDIIKKNQDSSSLTQEEMEDRIKIYVVDHLFDPELVNVPPLEKHFFLSPKTLRRIFVKKFGQSPKHYIKSKRLERAFYMLLTETISIKELSEKMGYLNSNNFTKEFTKLYGFPPSDVKEKL